MMNRRSLLIGLGSILLGQGLAGCSTLSKAALQIQILEDSIPAQLLAEFQRQVKQTSVSISPKPQLADLFTLLQTWKHRQQSSSGLPSWIPVVGTQPPPPIADLVTLGDYWLAPAIQQGLIQPLNPAELTQWSQLPSLWQTLVRRNAEGSIDLNGTVWAAPYRWGTTVIAYRVEQFQSLGWTPTDWSDLWRPELSGKISLLDSPRETIGLTLKKLGQSINTTDLNAVSRLQSELQALQQQARFYSSDAYLQPLLLGDTWAAVGWSTDILPLLKRDRRIAAIVPASGTILTADLWVHPAGATKLANQSSLVSQWIDFWWKPETALQLAQLGLDPSPVLKEGDRSRLPKTLQANSLLLPPDDVLQKSEFLQPIPAAAIEQYRQLWLNLRQTG
ncbi:MAG TPA: extracellular solute-binding protein [Crinalium sp.]|jgi:putative spermidine/putrescine transport system substrate-binding protein